MNDRPQRRRSDAPADADVIVRVLDGDTQAFSILVVRYQQWLYRHAVTMVLDHDTAKDMVQDALVRAYTRLRDCRQPEHFRAWLFQTLRHRCLDHLKGRRQHLPVDEMELHDNAEGPAAAAERMQVSRHIDVALGQLSPEQREAFVMHYVDGMPYETMAALLGVSVSGVKMRALRAREALSTALRHVVTAAPGPSSLSQAGDAEATAAARRKRMRIVSVFATLAVLGASQIATAQEQAPQVRIDTALARARDAGVPVALLESKIAEGKAKGVSLERIAIAIERREAALEKASQAFRGHPDANGSLAVGADAIETGVSEAVLKAVAESAPRDRRNVAIAALTELVRQGTVPEAALERVREALRRGPDALANLPAAAAAGQARRDGNAPVARVPGSGPAPREAAPPAGVPAPGAAPQAARPEGAGRPTPPSRGGR